MNIVPNTYYKKRCVSILLSMILLLISSASIANKIIVTGWDSPTPSQWRKQLAQVESRAFFTGYVIKPTRIVGNREVISSYVFIDELWRWNDFKQAVSDLSNAKSLLIKDNFLLVSANPGNIDFFDDAAWVNVVEHWRLIARLAKVTGMKGIAVDTEPYVAPYKQFAYLSQRQKSKYSYWDYKEKARYRGREVLTAVLEEYPEITIFWYRFLSNFLNVLHLNVDADSILYSNSYGLFPDFASGMLDAANSDVIFVEGNEDAYLFNKREDFQLAYAKLRKRPINFIDKKYDEFWNNQVKIGHGIYIDAYFNNSDNKYFVAKNGLKVGGRILTNTVAALNSSDGWVWIYGEKGYWWKNNVENLNTAWIDKDTSIKDLRKVFVDKEINTISIVSEKNINIASWRKSNEFIQYVDYKCFYKDYKIPGDVVFAIAIKTDTKSYLSGNKLFIKWKKAGGFFDFFDNVDLFFSKNNKAQQYNLVGAPKDAEYARVLFCSNGKNTENKLIIKNLSIKKVVIE